MFAVWKQLITEYQIHINFAYRTFVWSSEASLKAQVHCVIIGFSSGVQDEVKKIFSSERLQLVHKINPYLIEGETIFIEKRTKPLCAVPEISKGSQPTDGGHLILTEDEYREFIKNEPNSIPYIHMFLGANEFLNAKKKYCLWLVNISPTCLKSMPKILERVQNVKSFREQSKIASTRKWAEMPTLFTENRQPSNNYIVIPEVSSGMRRYIPMGFLTPEIICSNKLQLIAKAEIYHFGVLMSNVHMAWTRAVCGRLKSDYDYSAKIVYNNFPWCNPTDEQRVKIKQTAQGILDARAKYPDSSLADLYDDLTMPPELRKAHVENDKAVMRAYGLSIKDTTESSCVAFLMSRYQELTAKNG